MIRSNASMGTHIDKAYARFGVTSLIRLIVSAYRVNLYQVSGPHWTWDVNFDVLGKIPEGVSTDKVPEMLQTLLEERFKLKAHFENKEMAGYALVIGKKGSTLQSFTPGESMVEFKGGGMPMSLDNYAALMGDSMGIPVVDETGLKGLYMLPFAAAMRPMQARFGAGEGGGIAASSEPGGSLVAPDGTPDPSIAPALIGGLKLESRKLRVKVLVVDHVEATPTAN
jgi:uncharacterized protein (TIGR03435 family)